MDFNISFKDSEKREMNIIIFFLTLIFILSIMGAIWLQISVESEARFLIWYVVYFVGLFEIILMFGWQDRKTWMITKKKNSISYRNRFGKIKEIQVVDIIKVEVNRYARIKVFCEGDKVFLSRLLWEYPGMIELVTVFRDNKSIFEFQDEETEKQFWESVNYFV